MMMTHCRDNDGCGHEDGVDDDILPEDEVNVNHDELVNKGEGKVKQGRDVEQVVKVFHISRAVENVRVRVCFENTQ